jgi:hypothetical protein
MQETIDCRVRPSRRIGRIINFRVGVGNPSACLAIMNSDNSNEENSDSLG